MHLGIDEFVLRDDAGVELRFKGTLFSETSYFDEEQETLTRLKLYTTDDGRQIYSVVSGTLESKSHRFYSLRIEKDICHIDNGKQEMSLRTSMLLTVVSRLCGIDLAQADNLRDFLEESHKSASA